MSQSFSSTPQPYLSRFTLQGHRLLDTSIKKQLKHIVRQLSQDHVQGELAAIWLGGSYGRGEGAVRRSENTETVVGDYDIFLMYHQAAQAKACEKKFPQWEHRLQQLIGFQVDLKTPGTLENLYAITDHFYWQNLCLCHQKLWVSPRLERQQKQVSMTLHTLQPAYALDLLLQGVKRLLSGECGGDVLLGFGDALLLEHKVYAHTLQGRLQKMYTLQHELGIVWLRELFFAYQDAIRERLYPTEQSLHLSQAKLNEVACTVIGAYFTGIEAEQLLTRNPKVFSSVVTNLKHKKERMALLGLCLLQPRLLPGVIRKSFLPRHVYQAMHKASPVQQKQGLTDYFLRTLKILYANNAVYRMDNI